jgi:PAS domain S-box-containing protein
MTTTYYSILAGILAVAAVVATLVLPIETPYFNGLLVFIGLGTLLALPTFWLQSHKLISRRRHATPPTHTVSLAYISPRWRCVKANKFFSQLLGYSAHELSKMDFQRLIHPGDLKYDLPNLQKMLQGQQAHYQTVQRYLDKNGDIVTLQVAVTLTRDKKGKPLYFAAQFQKPHAVPALHYVETVYSTLA